MLKMNVSYTTEGNEFTFYYQVGAAAVSCAMKELDSQTNHFDVASSFDATATYTY